MTSTCKKCKKEFHWRKIVGTGMCLPCHEKELAGIALSNASLALGELDFKDWADSDFFHELMERCSAGANQLLWDRGEL